MSSSFVASPFPDARGSCAWTAVSMSRPAIISISKISKFGAAGSVRVYGAFEIPSLIQKEGNMQYPMQGLWKF